MGPGRRVLAREANGIKVNPSAGKCTRARARTHQKVYRKLFHNELVCLARWGARMRMRDSGAVVKL